MSPALTVTTGDPPASIERLIAEERVRSEAEKKGKEVLDALSRVVPIAVESEHRGVVVSMPSTALFAAGDSDLLPGARERLEPVAEALSQGRDSRVSVEVQSSSRGIEPSNIELSQRRAELVRNVLVANGVRRDRLIATSVPAKEGRVEIVVVPASDWANQRR